MAIGIESESDSVKFSNMVNKHPVIFDKLYSGLQAIDENKEFIKDVPGANIGWSVGELIHDGIKGDSHYINQYEDGLVGWGQEAIGNAVSTALFAVGGSGSATAIRSGATSELGKTMLGNSMKGFLTGASVNGALTFSVDIFEDGNISKSKEEYISNIAIGGITGAMYNGMNTFTDSAYNAGKISMKNYISSYAFSGGLTSVVGNSASQIANGDKFNSNSIETNIYFGNILGAAHAGGSLIKDVMQGRFINKLNQYDSKQKIITKNLYEGRENAMNGIHLNPNPNSGFNEVYSSYVNANKHLSESIDALYRANWGYNASRLVSDNFFFPYATGLGSYYIDKEDEE